jgi:phenylacetic acid degradation operon negative regulatory protein
MAKELLDIHVNTYTVILSLYGQYVLPRGEEIWIGSLIRALEALDFSAASVRAIVSRMQRRGLLQSRRQGRHSFYRLSEQGNKDVHQGGSRAFASEKPLWDEHWTVVTYSVPESERKKRDSLREVLRWGGFGPLGSGTWISPHPPSAELEDKLRRYRLWDYLDLFQADYLGPHQFRDLVDQAWPQLAELAEHYRAYIDHYEPVQGQLKCGDLDDKSCFATRLRSLFHFVGITLEDPGLPAILLPESWPRPAGQKLFKQLQHSLAEPAERFFDHVYGLVQPESAKTEDRLDS